ncbi:class I SAM-dependent methyltransferase [Geomobilimonas luticola]|nr:class I SAM-dependent methyltransferase [Geomobilimonas luticola]
MDFVKQAETGRLVSPKTRERLFYDEDSSKLITQDKTESYSVLNGKVPVMVIDPEWAGEYADSSRQMVNEYMPENCLKIFLRKCVESLREKDFRSVASIEAFNSIFEGDDDDRLFLSVGGGPQRPHPALVNLNIGPFPNVDIIADAHQLPYGDESVDAIYCEAVLEHLQEPKNAIAEMWRVLKPEGRVYAITPFLQAYHGYPYHFQNYTLTGHTYAFESLGFDIVASGPCVGPMNAVVGVISTFMKEYLPKIIGVPLRFIWEMVGLMVLKPFDKLLLKRPNAYVLASTTYLLARKKPVVETDKPLEKA